MSRRRGQKTILHDLSPLVGRDSAVWPGDSRFELQWSSSLEEGIKAYSEGGGAACPEAGLRGAIREGQKARLTILNGPLSSAQDLKEREIVATYAGDGLRSSGKRNTDGF